MIGRFGDLAINRLFTNTFSCVSVRFSPRLELDVATVSGSGSVSPPFHDPRRLACRVFLRSHHRFSFASSFGLSCSCASGTTLGSDASSVVPDLGFCGVSTTASRFSSDQLFSTSRRTPSRIHGSPCISSSSSGFAVESSFASSGTSGAAGGRSERFNCRRDVHCCRLRFLWCFDDCSKGLLLTSCARRVLVRFARFHHLRQF